MLKDDNESRLGTGCRADLDSRNENEEDKKGKGSAGGASKGQAENAA
jgi:hypothetical protein